MVRAWSVDYSVCMQADHVMAEKNKAGVVQIREDKAGVIEIGGDMSRAEAGLACLKAGVNEPHVLGCAWNILLLYKHR